jgi:hypothetical protein
LSCGCGAEINQKVILFRYDPNQEVSIRQIARYRPRGSTAPVLALALLGCGRVSYDPVTKTAEDGGIVDAQPQAEACAGSDFLVLETITITNNVPTELRDYPVKVTVDTAAWIASGTLPGDCSALAVRADAQLLTSWLVPEHCGEPAATLWVRVPLVPGESQLSASVGICGDAPAGTPAQIFSYYEGFDEPRDWTVAQPDWLLHGDGVEQVGDGVLRLPPAAIHEAALESTVVTVHSHTEALGVRFSASPGGGDDFEIGVGTISTVELWHQARNGTWFTALHWDVLEGSVGSSSLCHRTAGQSAYVVAGQWYEAEFAYQADANASATFDAQRQTESFSYSLATSGCPALPSLLSILIVLDHDSAGANSNVEIDWIYVRPRAEVEPSISRP